MGSDVVVLYDICHKIAREADDGALDFYVPSSFPEPTPSTSPVKTPLSRWSTRFDIITKCLTGSLPKTKPDFISETQWTAVTSEAQKGPLTRVTGIQKSTVLEISTAYTIECSALFCDVVMAQVLITQVSKKSYRWLVKSKYYGAKSKLKGAIRHLTFRFPIEQGNHDYFKRLIAKNLFVTDN
ncbi:MAG: hypothetical protein ACHQUC_05720 [Chlamydiales bacterium]